MWTENNQTLRYGTNPIYESAGKHEGRRSKKQIHQVTRKPQSMAYTEKDSAILQRNSHAIKPASAVREGLIAAPPKPSLPGYWAPG